MSSSAPSSIDSNDSTNESKKTALVTGASTGIGFAIAEFLIKNNYRVLAGYRKEQDGQKLSELGCESIRLDVTQAEEIDQAMASISRLDLLFNNAGIAVAGPVEHVPIKELRNQMEVNFFGLYLVTQKCIPLLRKSRGRIINISSISGKIAAPFMSPYAASKFAVEAVTDALRREVSDQGIEVISINPGPIRTPIWQKGVNAADTHLQNFPEEAKAIYEKPMRFMQSLIAELEKNAAPVEDVIRCVDHAIHSRRPKTRYYPGKGIRLQVLLTRLASDRVIDKLALSRFK